MKVLVTGAAGQLGSEVVRCLREYRMDVRGVDREDFDVRQIEAVHAAVAEAQPDAIVHCAAYTDVRRAETEPELCAEVNAMGTLNMVRAALKADAKLLYVSTSQVFPEEGTVPYDPADRPSAKTVYGLTKAQGEEAIRSLMTRYYILRTSWLYSEINPRIWDLTRQAREGRAITAAEDVTFSPTCVTDLARLIADMLRTERYGVYHAAAEGFCTPLDFAQMTVQLLGSRSTVRPEAPLRKPVNGRLNCRELEQAGFLRLPPWEESLSRFLSERLGINR